MYPPKHHLENDFVKIVETIKRFPLATLISPVENDCFITHIPFIYHNDPQPFGKIVGHIDRNNPHCAYLNNRKTYAIFNGPDTYISPTTYTTQQLPTWNYVKVHVQGICRTIDEPEIIKQILVDMANNYEKPDSAFKLERSHPRMNQLVNYIQGFEITIESWEGKFKLSQDKTAQDTRAAREKLVMDAQAELRDFIEYII